MAFISLASGVFALSAIMGGSGREETCRKIYGDCVWSKIPTKLYYRGGLSSAWNDNDACGFGPRDHPAQTTWQLDVAGCAQTQEVAILESWSSDFDSLESLVLDNNDLTALPAWLLKKPLTNLKRLSARGNKLAEFPEFHSDSKLTLVDMSDNDISTISFKTMDDSRNDLSLRFDGNPVASLVDWSNLELSHLPVRMKPGYDNGGFRDTLKTLNLTGNMIGNSVFTFLSTGGFLNIENLDISYNAISKLTARRVALLPSLKVLDVSGHPSLWNYLGDLPVNLDLLRMHACGITAIPSEVALAIEGTNISFFGNPGMINLDLETAGLEGRIPTWLRTLDSLKFVELSNNRITTLAYGDFPASIERIRLTSNTVPGQEERLTLEKDCFRGLVNLTYLSLSNNLNASFSDGILEESSLENLRYLNLHSTGLTSVDRNMFNVLQNLETLELSENPGLSIADGSFSELAKLKELNLKSIGLDVLESSTLQGLEQLEVLYLSANSGLTFGDGWSSSLVSLSYLDLHSTNLGQLSPSIFQGFPGPLKYLLLSGSSYSASLQFEPNWWGDVVTIESMACKRCNLTGDFSEDFLDAARIPPSLSYAYLYNNPGLTVAGEGAVHLYSRSDGVPIAVTHGDSNFIETEARSNQNCLDTETGEPSSCCGRIGTKVCPEGTVGFWLFTHACGFEGRIDLNNWGKYNRLLCETY